MISTQYFDDNWNDIRKGTPMNIRVSGTYSFIPGEPHGHHCHHEHHCELPIHLDHHHHWLHPNPHKIPILQCFDQHKPYGLATLHTCCGHPHNHIDDDDRPDWLKFKGAKKQRRQFEEIMPEDDEFDTAMKQDHAAHVSHHHVHLKPIEPDTESEEVEDDVIL